MSTPQGANGKGSRTPWRGGWGPLGDGRSKLARLARQIERELLEADHPATAHHRRLVRRSACLEALAEACGAQLGSDPKATRRALTALEKAADSKLAPLRASRNNQGRADLADDLLERLRAVPPAAEVRP